MPTKKTKPPGGASRGPQENRTDVSIAHDSAADNPTGPAEAAADWAVSLGLELQHWTEEAGAGASAPPDGRARDQGPDEPPPHGDADAPHVEVVPVIAVNRQPSHVRRKAWAAVRRCNDPPTLFERGDVFVQLGPHGARAVVSDALRGLLEDFAKWGKVTVDKGGEQKIIPVVIPGSLPATMLAQATHPLPPLDAIATTPCLGPRGELITRPGYHPDAKIYLIGDLHVDVPERPDAGQVHAARGLIIDDLLGDFPFVSDADRAHVVAALLLPVVRAMIPGPTPLHVIEAVAKGTGKGLLATVLGIVITGDNPAVTKYPAREGERQKTLMALLVEGAAIILLDNETKVLHSATLDAVLTATVWTGRILGVTAMARCPNRALWLLTSNNCQLGGDLARRTIRCRMDAGGEQPWLRDGFRHSDLPRWTQEHRAELAAALLTMARHWIAVGQSEYIDRVLGSFEPWTRTIGGILDAAGVPGFLGNLDEWYEVADSDAVEWSTLVTAWAEIYESRFVTATDLVLLADEHEVFGELLGRGGHRRDGSPDRGAVTCMGRALSSKRGALIAGHRIVKTQGRQGALYQALEVDPEGAEPLLNVRNLSAERAERVLNVEATGSAPLSPVESDGSTPLLNVLNLEGGYIKGKESERDIKRLREKEEGNCRVQADRAISSASPASDNAEEEF